jgi:hypothetical protein
MSTDPLPPTLNYAAPPGRTDLRTIATRQKAIMFCILAQLALLARFALPPGLQIIFSLVSFAVAITGAVFIFMLSMAVYNTGAGIVLGILAIVPLLGLLILLIVNGKATKILRENGIRVGLLGAKTNEIPAPGQVPIR